MHVYVIALGMALSSETAFEKIQRVASAMHNPHKGVTLPSTIAINLMKVEQDLKDLK